MVNHDTHTASAQKRTTDYMEKQWRAVNTTLIIFTTFVVMNIPPMVNTALCFMEVRIRSEFTGSEFTTFIIVKIHSYPMEKKDVFVHVSSTE